MNNGRPPYGNTPAWNQQNQGGQPGGAQGGYAPQQPTYGGYPQGYAPQPQGYAPQQGGYAPQGQQAPQQGYAQRPAYPQQPGYGQQTPQQGYAPQSQGYAQQGYPRQPQQAGYAQGQQGYPPQQTYQQSYPPNYAQSQQPGAQMYVGYQPPRRAKKVSAETVALMVVGGVLPVLFILGLLLPGAAALKWVFVVLTVAAIGYVWARDAIKGNLKVTLTMIYGALAVIALVSALTSAAPSDARNPGAGGADPGSQQGGSVSDPFGGLEDMTFMDTDPPPASAPTDDPSIIEGAARQQLESFFYFWKVNNLDSMINLTSPSWLRSVQEPKAQLFSILTNRTPTDYEITNMSGTEADTSRTATVRATIDKNNGRDPEVYIFTIVMSKEDGIWYVDPRSLESNERESATPETGNNTPTQPPLTTPYVGLTLYYNPDGGSLYHIDPECSSTNKKYLPLKGSFSWEQVNVEPYSKLSACNTCGAPLREQ